MFNVATRQLMTVSYVNESVTAVAHSFDNRQLAVGTGLKYVFSILTAFSLPKRIRRLYLYNGDYWRYIWVGFIIDGNITCLAYDSLNTLWIDIPLTRFLRCLFQ